MKKTIQLILLCTLIILLSYLIGMSRGEFMGADEQMQEQIMEINQEYTPWFISIWEPPSGEIESFLFCLQAAIGSGFVGYYIGKKRSA